ncbi:MAG: DNA translocase FtsK 4TM domain-containing protein, partial [Planctomycetota bacterium]
MKEKKSYLFAAECLGIAGLVFLLCSCLSFDMGDWPSSFAYPHNSPTVNLCGPIGAFCCYYMLYYVGPGVFLILVSLICFLLVKAAGSKLNQPALRMVGLGLLAGAASCSFYFLWPHKVFGFPFGSGGVLGVGLAELLKSHFALLGTFILVAATWIVGIVLLADSLFLMLLGWVGIFLAKIFGFAMPVWAAARQQSEVISEIWQKLSVRQRPVTVGPRVTHFGTEVRGREKTERESHPVEPAAAQPLKLTTQKVHKAGKAYIPPSYEDYTLPSPDLLADAECSFASVQEKVVKAKAAALERLLNEFSINARVVSADTGPVVTMFELELGAGVKVSQISTLSNDMARALGAGAVQVVAPLPGKHTIG